MNQPTSWELFQSVLIGTVAGVMSSGIVERGTIYVSTMAFILWIFLTITFEITKPLFSWIEDIRQNEDTEDRPYKDIKYAS